MDLGVEAAVFAVYAAAMLAVYIAGRYLIVPVKWCFVMVLNSLLGGCAIFIINLLGSAAGIFIPVNIFTSAAAGLLGVPGTLMLLLLFF